MRQRCFRLPLALGAAAVLAGLAGPAAGDGRPRVHEVAVEDFAFVPAILAVRPGDRVAWVNRDLVPHTATAADGTWDSGSLRRQARFTLVLAADGTIAYRCAYHPEMRGVITVAP
ncbi:MAG: cupredoxin family copper-binding protein [Kiloniellaceae bacterium]